jgi:hypothetical protein
MRDGGILPSATIDPVTGTMHAVWPDSRNGAGGTRDILEAHSRDGRRWSAPRRVNSDPAAAGVDHFTAAVGAYAGQVVVAFRTRGLVPTPAGLVGTSIAVSRDGGLHFDRARPVGPATDLRYAAKTGIPARNAFLGDYQQVASGPGVAYAVWCVATPPAGDAAFHQTTWSATVHT